MLAVVDAFAAECFRGNPAAVFIAEDNTVLCDTWMQSLAGEMNLSETVFVQRLPKESKPGNPHWSIRWMTPTVEVALCGHATLAAAWNLQRQGLVSVKDVISFHSRQSGVLTASFEDGERVKVVLNFPSDPVTVDHNVPQERADAIARALSGKSSMTAKDMGIQVIGRGRSDLLVVFKDDRTVRQLTPDFLQLSPLSERGVTVTARSSHPAMDFVSRFFAPNAGVNEDPVCGSAHCTLFTYWWNQITTRRTGGHLLAYQASARGGFLEGKLEGDRVRLAGVCALVWEGQLSQTALKNHGTRAKL